MAHERLVLSQSQVKNYALSDIERLLKLSGSSLTNFKPMPLPDDFLIAGNTNHLIQDELSYNTPELHLEHVHLLGQLTNEQRGVYDEILGAVDSNCGKLFFVHGFGGTGKTFVWDTLGAAIRSKGGIVLNVASSGIAALLLKGGRTAHSRFGIPLVVTESTSCSITAGSDLATLIKEAKLIIWDEAPMMSKHCFETVDRSLRDIIDKTKPFGGKVVVFGGDFRQILPVIPNGGRVETVIASLNSSALWRDCKVLKLTKNMRLLSRGLSDADALELREFSKWILDVGEGKINEPNDGEVDITIPDDLLISDCRDPIYAIVDDVYGARFVTEKDHLFYQGRAILSPRNQDVDVVNDYMLSRLTGMEKTYYSSDSIEPSDTGINDPMVYSQEFLNSIKISGLPKHCLVLKVGAPIMLLRSIDPRGGLCNGTRLLVTQLADHVIEAKFVSGTKVGQKVLIPRMFVSPPEARFPFRMRRRQFPVVVAFAMTINKSQGQTLKRVGLYLPRPVFTHGQLYVALSRVSSRKGLRILITDKDGKAQKNTTNVVYKEVFQNLT